MSGKTQTDKKKVCDAYEAINVNTTDIQFDLRVVKPAL